MAGFSYPGGKLLDIDHHRTGRPNLEEMTVRPYPTYKESGIPWLEDVPGHWSVEKLKNLARPGYKTFVDGDWIESAFITAEGIRLIQTGNIGVGSYREKGFRYISEATFQAFGCTEIHVNDVLICRLGDPVGRACLAPKLGVRMITSVDVCILKPRRGVNSKFLVYAMSSQDYLNWVGSLVRGSTRDRVSRSMLGWFSIPLPPLLEQDAIVRFLDHADRRIRRYIAAKKKLIALLNEQKQAIIQRAVTRGLDPNVRLKASGVEWLGAVPEHWHLTRLKQLLQSPLANGIFKKKDAFGRGVPLVNVADIYQDDFTIRRDQLELVDATEPEVGTFRAQVGDIFFVRSSLKLEGTGRSAVLADCDNSSVFECHLVRARPQENLISPRFLVLFLNSVKTRDFLISRANMVTMSTLAQGVIGGMEVIVPPRKEQERILREIDPEIAKNAVAIRDCLHQINLVREYRTRLIADVVTGKLDVREAAARLPEETDESEPLDEVEALAEGDVDDDCEHALAPEAEGET